MIHNSVIIELPGSSCQHRKCVLPTAATPLQNKSPPRQETLHPQRKSFSTLFPDENILRFSFTGGSRSVRCSTTESEVTRPEAKADRRYWACSAFCSSDVISTATINSTSQQNSGQRRAELLLPNKPWSELKKKKKRKTKISSLWRRVNKPSVGGGHWTQEPKFSFQSAESKTCHESRSPTDDKKTEITRTAWGMFHIILLFFFLLYFHHSNGKI